MKQRKISLGKYPYTYARVSVMKSHLLKKEDYHKLLKMSLNEVISFLQSSEYKKAIDELAVKYSGIELMEMALNNNLSNTWSKLRRISPQEVDLLIDAYLERADLWNIKTILRGLHTKTNPIVVSTMLLHAGPLEGKKLESLAKSESVEDLLKRLNITGIKPESFSQALESYRNDGSIIEIENFLDREYHDRMIQFTKRIPSEGRLFKQFMESEAETVNIMNMLRLKRAGVGKQELAGYVIGMPSHLIKNLMLAESSEEEAKLLANTLSEKAAESVSSGKSLAEVELELGKSLLRKTTRLIHQHPLTVDVILGYMFAKEIEVKNLKLLLKSRQLNLRNDFIEEQMII